MWCKNCNIETEQEKCPLCGSTTEEDTPIEVFWCDSCRVPVLQKVSQADKDYFLKLCSVLNPTNI